MLGLVEDWQSSGLSQKAFCNLHGIKIGTLGYWVARLKEEGNSSGGFVPLPTQTTRCDQSIEIIYPTGVRLRVGCELSLISQLIRL